MEDLVKLALIIDDEPTICLLVEQILLMNRISAVTAGSIEEAKKLLSIHNPELIFVDHRLPDGLGLEFVPFLREQCPDSKIIVMTAQEEFNKQTIASSGADAFLSKPFEIEKIFQLVS